MRDRSPASFSTRAFRAMLTPIVSENSVFRPARAPAAEVRLVVVVEAVGPERRAEGLPGEVRVALRGGIPPHVDQPADAVEAEEPQEVRELARGVADRVNDHRGSDPY